MGRLVRISDATGPSYFGTSPISEEERARRLAEREQAVQQNPAGAELSGGLELPRPGTVQSRRLSKAYQPEQALANGTRERAWEERGARALEPQPVNRLKSGVQSIVTTGAGAIPLIWDTAVQLNKNTEDRLERLEENGALDRLVQVNRQIRGLEGNETGEALDYIRSQERWRELDAERKLLEQQVHDAYVQTPVSPEAPGMQLMRQAGEYREEALKGLEGVPRFLGETVLSIGQNAALLPTAAINPAIPLAAMGTISAADKMYELNARGFSPSESLTRGVVSGGIEAATEKIPLENLLSVVKTGGNSALRNLLRQAGIEAGEESVSYLANYIADLAAQDPEAEFSLQELARSAAGGGISGGVFGGAAMGVNALTRPRVNQTMLPTEPGQTVTLPSGEAQMQTTEAGPGLRPGQVMLPSEPGQVTVLPDGIDNPSGGGYDGAIQENRTGGTSDARGEKRFAAPEGAIGADVRGEAGRTETMDSRIPSQSSSENGGIRQGEIKTAGEGIAYERGQASDLGAGRGETVRLQAEEAGILRGRDGTIPEAAGGVYQGKSGTTGQAKIEEWAEGHIIENPSKPATRASKLAQIYVPDVVTVDDAALKARNPNAWALTSGGTIYISDAVPAELADIIGHHEAVHAIRQRRTPSYLDFIDTVGSNINFMEAQPSALELVVATRYPGKTLLDLSMKELDTVYDELNALVWGYHKADPENARAQFAGVFQDYDAYIQALDKIMEDARQTGGDIPNPGAGPEYLTGPESSVGGAREGFDPYTHMQNEYGTIDPGEKPARVIDVPKRTAPNNRVSLSARTIMEAAITPDAVIPDIAQMVVDGKFSRIPLSNQQLKLEAESEIRKVGYENALSNWIDQVNSGRTNDLDLAIGATLYNAAMSAGDTKRALDIAYYYTQASTQGARALQANRILKTLTPDGQLYMIQKTVNNVNNAIRKSGRRVSASENVPVELWLQRVGERLADELSSRLDIKKPQAKTVAETILNDLRRYANETAPKRSANKSSRTEMDRIMDLFHNRTAYEEAWQAAKNTVTDNFERNPEKLEAFYNWMDSSLEYVTRLTKELTGQGEIVLSEELANKFLEAETDEARDAVLDEINQYIADRIPSGFMEKFNALRYTNMLGNFKTQIRNIGGNLIMKGVRLGRTKVQATLEAAVNKATKGKTGRTTSYTRDREIYKLAKQEFDQAQKEIMGEQKYSVNGITLPADIHERRTIFKNNGTWGLDQHSPAHLLRKGTDLFWKGLEGYRRLTNWSMEKGDLIFARSAYADALSRYLKANGVTAEQYRDGTVDADLLERARNHAIREAQEATFRDKNSFSDAIAAIGFRNANTNTKRVMNAAVQGVIPYRRTPANVAVRAAEYSPLGLINAGRQSAKAAKQAFQARKGIATPADQVVTGNDIINSLSKSVTGIGFLALGYVLGKAGILTGMEPEDEQEKALQNQEGRQDYSLYIPDGVADTFDWPRGLNFTMDWLSPAAIPLFIGAELGIASEKTDMQGKDLLAAIASSSNVLLNMSMLQSVNEQLSNISYSDNPLVDLVFNSLTDYITAGLTSTLGGQIERSMEDTRMTTYIDENSPLPRDIQYLLGSQSARIPIPGVDYQQIPYTDEWGRTEENGSLLSRAFNQFFNPSYVSSDTSTPVIRETRRLYDETGDSSVIAQRPESEITIKTTTVVDGEETTKSREIYLTAGQYLQYSTFRGQMRDDMISSLLKNPAYNALDTQDQVSVINDVYTYTDNAAKMEISNHTPDGWVAKAMESGIDPADYLIFRAMTADLTADKDKNGNSIPNSKKEKVLAAIDMMDLSDEEKDALYYAMDYKESELWSAPWH